MKTLLTTGIKSNIAKKRFYEHLKRCNASGSYPNQNEIAYIIQKLDMHNISQIIFDYGEANLSCILSYFESLEYYEYCAIIRDKVELHNKALSTKVKL